MSGKKHHGKGVRPSRTTLRRSHVVQPNVQERNLTTRNGVNNVLSTIIRELNTGLNDLVNDTHNLGNDLGHTILIGNRERLLNMRFFLRESAQLVSEIHDLNAVFSEVQEVDNLAATANNESIATVLNTETENSTPTSTEEIKRVTAVTINEPRNMTSRQRRDRRRHPETEEDSQPSSSLTQTENPKDNNNAETKPSFES